jgi:hypothetical protein
MATTFSMFDTTPAGAVAAIKAAILTSSDWSNPAGDRVVCTTTRGAAMVVDLADAAATAVRLQFGVYRTTGLADKIVRYAQWRASGGATSDPLHVVVSAGKEHLFITVEGPRAGEANPVDTSNGSYRPLFFLCDLVPYFAADAVPAVVCGGSSVASVPTSATGLTVHTSRNAVNSGSWVAGILETLQPPAGNSSARQRYSGNSLSASGVLTARPYLVFEDVAGQRGRLATFFALGWNVGANAADFPAQTYQRIGIGSATYIGLTVTRSPASAAISPFAETGSGDGPGNSPVIAVPYA